jgi:V/A-type H+-transporting ATPase subunit I
MRIPVKKILFLGVKDIHSTFFERAQNIGWFEFISVSGQKPHLFPKQIEDLKLAIKILKKQMNIAEQAMMERPKIKSIIAQILSLKHDIDKHSEEKRLLNAEIIKVHPLGDFDLSDFEHLKEETGKVFQFFFLRHERLKQDEIPEDLIFINRELDFDYYLYVGNSKFVHPAFTEVYVRKSLHELYEDKENLTKIIHEKEKQLKELTCYLDDLETYLLEELSLINLKFAKEDVDYYLDNSLFGIEAWIPENKMEELKNLINGLPVWISNVAIEENEVVPTYLENKGFARIGQDLVEIYDIPSTSDKDPSNWVLWSFAIFFGMIVSDAGYGLLFLLFLLYMKFKLPNLKGAKKRFLNLGFILSIATITWGVLISSYFSISFSPDSRVAKSSILYQLSQKKIDYHLKLKDETYSEWVKEYPGIEKAKDAHEVILAGTKVQNGEKVYKFMEDMNNNLLLEVAILVGLIHLSFSFLRNLYRNWSGIGWVITMWGSYLFFPKIVGAVSLFQYMHLVCDYNTCVAGEQLLYGGLAITVILALIQERLGGLQVFFKAIEVFADSLSYLRIYALALAGMVMASTFNDMGVMCGGGIVGAIVIFLGHATNITLALMAGVLHGLRLNFLEWYHHSFEGGGRKFRPLKLFTKE